MSDQEELPAGIRERVLALDEPVGRDDWSDVVRRSGRGRVTRRTLVRPALLVAALAAAAVVGWTAHHRGQPGQAPLYASNGCETTSSPLCVVWGSNELAGAVSSSAISAVTIQFTDGTSEWLPLQRAADGSEVFIYRVPAGKTVSVVGADGLQGIQRQVTWYST